MKWHRTVDGGLFAGFFAAFAMRAYDEKAIGLAVCFGVIGLTLYLYASWELIAKSEGR